MAGFFKINRGVAAAALFVVGFVLLTASAANAVGGEGESWPTFNESDGCGSPWARGPKVETSGSLSSSTVLRGPHAGYFGRTIDQVWDSLFWWDVPMSNDESLRLHERMAPALAEVEQNLAEAASQGFYYSIVDRYTFAYTARTVGGSYRVSQHAFGNAVDINSTTNPYSATALITNMPDWFVESWADAGFCWGGNWISVKDPMHYNWRGPLFTPGITELPLSYPPLTVAESFTRTMHTAAVPGPLDHTQFRLLMDGDNDGGIDVVNVSPARTGLVVDVIRASTDYESCSVSRYATSKSAEGSAAIPGDWDRDGAQDLWVINDAGDLEVTAFLRNSDFTETASASIPAAPGDAYLSADHDVDGWGDLYILRYSGSDWSVEVRSGADRFETVLVSASLPGTESDRFTAVDRDLDQIPDIVVVGQAGSRIHDGASNYSESESIPFSASGFDDVAGADFDGDGRHDLVILDGTTLEVLAGNTALAGMQVTSWFEFPPYICSTPGYPYPYDGVFRDDDDSIHQGDIEAIAATSVTRGCNPPLNDLFCPHRVITRGELAAFISRALGLPSGTADTFIDDDESIFEADIESLVKADIALPCNSTGDEFCPNDPVTRVDMARFLVLAFQIPESDSDAFVDDDGSAFEADINAIAAVGVTKGCNPPDNDMFCPDRAVPRQEMASFMVRALKLVMP